MKRQALLIETSTLKGHDDLPGARQDVQNYKDFLLSPFGGAWNDDEIKLLSKPSKKSLMEWITYIGKCDYGFVTFSGHGHHVVGKSLNETRCCINDNEEVSVYDLNSGSPWTLIVADVCRKVTIVGIEKYAKSYQFALEEARAALQPDRKRCRELFEKSILEAERGPIYMFSCGLNETASDVASFSRALVTVGEGWAEQRKPGVFKTRESFNAAAIETTRRNKQQHPEMDPGRRTVHLPFAVLAY